ncbi:3-keto-5-aminohexanoate cleavage protein [Bradyrhizobium liaoningense]|uniref:3-keto-5-aminohexanoate cleavage protein n=1 Tax=Bradyrhizobium liaoningense TaxID=43992 RepID=UPI001BA68AA3|nr:3-keto-5-aminohexanoate cleavage protein [Bradyrhizobium liaoningense]MBR0840436.1 3-keto-5-aminohexanoate cleavage protein [Bradyrhizobium liaoningense]
MAKSRKIIVSCAVTGSVHTPSMSPYLPVTPQRIIEESVAAAEAGAAILHLHARDPETGAPSPKASIFKQFLPSIKQQCDAVVNITTGGGIGMSMDERLEAAHWAQPELCSLNMGSMNFGLFPAAEKIGQFKNAWEKPFLENTRNTIMSNTFGQIERVVRELGQGYGTRFEFECYDVGHVHTLHWFVEQGLLTPPFFIQGVFGVLGGLAALPEHVMHMRRLARDLFADQHEFSALGAGRHQMAVLTLTALLGGNVRVGLEDSLYLGRGEMAQSNADQVRKVRRILEELGFEIASPQEAREILALKGADRVAF